MKSPGVKSPSQQARTCSAANFAHCLRCFLAERRGKTDGRKEDCEYKEANTTNEKSCTVLLKAGLPSPKSHIACYILLNIKTHSSTA